MRLHRALLLMTLCCAANASPPEKHAAASTSPSETPAVDTMQQKQAGEGGTTIVGEQDSDVGLYLTPWKEEHADNIDPPPSLLDEPPQPLDAHNFARQVRDAGTVSAYRRELRLPNR
jgi:hypothetical protein